MNRESPRRGKSCGLCCFGKNHMGNIRDYIVKDYENIEAGHYLGIFGHPIRHTLSPVIHDTISDALSLDQRYVPFDIEGDLEARVKDAYESGIVGLNITVPHKQAVIPALIDIDPDAKAIGAVNTLVRTEGGYKGYNTDMPGLYAAIKSEGMDVKDQAVILLGAGGAARAACYMCMKYGARSLYIINRTKKKAEALIADIRELFPESKVKLAAFSADEYKSIEKDSYVMIQCTSVGLKKDDGLPYALDDDFFSMANFGVDLIYNPAETPFLKKLSSLSVPNMNGLKMLLFQGVLANQLWNGIKIEKELSDRVYLKLCDAVYGKDNIILIGYMGCGKTTVGKMIAKKYGYIFVDTDTCIVEREGMTIPEIFEQKGEDYFRNVETALIRDLQETLHHAVISTGGGLPLREENAQELAKLGKVFYLCATPEQLYERVKGDKNRPLLNCEDPYKKVCEMVLLRHPKYEAAADITIEAGNTPPADLAAFILDQAT